MNIEYPIVVQGKLKIYFIKIWIIVLKPVLQKSDISAAANKFIINSGSEFTYLGKIDSLVTCIIYFIIILISRLTIIKHTLRIHNSNTLKKLKELQRIDKSRICKRVSIKIKDLY